MLPRSGTKTIAVMQPTFLPWLGYFEMMSIVDVWVVLSDVQFSKQSWQQRNRIRTKRGLEWLTVPVQRKGKQLIEDVELADDPKWLKKTMNTLFQNYKRAKYAPDYMERLLNVITAGFDSGSLLLMNCGIIGFFRDVFNIMTPIALSSEVLRDGRRGEGVAELCEAFGATHYLSPIGAIDYLEQERACFDERDIEIDYFKYDHPIYTQQFQPFMPYAAALDYLFNCGGNLP